MRGGHGPAPGKRSSSPSNTPSNSSAGYAPPSFPGLPGPPPCPACVPSTRRFEFHSSTPFNYRMTTKVIQTALRQGNEAAFFLKSNSEFTFREGSLEPLGNDDSDPASQHLRKRERRLAVVRVTLNQKSLALIIKYLTRTFYQFNANPAAALSVADSITKNNGRQQS